MSTTVRTVATGLSEDEKAAALRNYKELQARDAEKATAVSDYIEEAKSSLIFQYNWEELLGAAPMVINLIGACYITASSPFGMGVILTPPKKGFQYLSNTSLRANLIECGDIGAKAFTMAKPKMNHIELVSGKVFHIVNEILTCLQEGPQAKKVLKLAMAQLKHGAEDCSATALSMDKEFSHWLDYVCELHEVTVANETTVAAQKLANETQLMAKQTQYEMTDEAKKKAQDAVDTLGKSLKVAQDAYKTASDKYPSGWEIIGQQFVSSLGQTLNNALNQAIPVLVQNLNPMARVQAGVNMFEHRNDPAKNDAVAATGTAAPDAQVTPPDYSDPAYTAVTIVKDSVSNLLALITGGAEGGVDWETIKGVDNDPKKGLSYCKDMLEFSKKNFQPSTKDPSIKLSSALAACITVAAEIEKEAAKSNDISWVPPAKDSEQVKGWQKSVRGADNTVTIINSVACSTSRSRPPLVNPGNPADTNKTETGGLANAILNKASERLATTQAMYKTSQDNYQKATEKLVDVSTSMAEIAGELSKLKSDKITMTEVKIILTKCIESLVNLKAQVRKLVNFFKALSEIVSYVETEHVQPFLENVDVIAEDTPSINGFTYIDMQRQILFSATIMIRSYFGLFKDIANMYVQSTMCLDEGFDLIDQLGLEIQGKNSDVIEEKQQRLQKWTSRATGIIKDLVSEKQREIKGGMEQRVQAIADDSQALPPPPEHQVQAIEEGKNIVTEAAAKGIENYKPPAAKPIERIRRILLAPE